MMLRRSPLVKSIASSRPLGEIAICSIIGRLP